MLFWYSTNQWTALVHTQHWRASMCLSGLPVYTCTSQTGHLDCFLRSAWSSIRILINYLEIVHVVVAAREVAWRTGVSQSRVDSQHVVLCWHRHPTFFVQFLDSSTTHVVAGATSCVIITKSLSTVSPDFSIVAVAFSFFCLNLNPNGFMWLFLPQW